jgi:hypothetical protein
MWKFFGVEFPTNVFLGIFGNYFNKGFGLCLPNLKDLFLQIAKQ